MLKIEKDIPGKYTSKKKKTCLTMFISRNIEQKAKSTTEDKRSHHIYDATKNRIMKMKTHALKAFSSISRETFCHYTYSRIDPSLNSIFTQTCPLK